MERKRLRADKMLAFQLGSFKKTNAIFGLCRGIGGNQCVSRVCLRSWYRQVLGANQVAFERSSCKTEPNGLKEKKKANKKNRVSLRDKERKNKSKLSEFGIIWNNFS